MIKKTYMSVYWDKMIMKVRVNDRLVVCEFGNASRHNRNIKGTFSTNNPDVIKALEARPDFGTGFRVVSEELSSSRVVDTPEYRNEYINEPEEDEVKEEVKEEAKAEVKAEEVQLEGIALEEIKPEKAAPEPVKENLKVIPADKVRNVQEAKDWMKRRYPSLTIKQLANKAAVTELAQERGIAFAAFEETI